MEFRPFRNTDTRAVVELWNRLPALSLRATPLNLTWLELYVLSKPSFDPRGLILATDGGAARGMIHVVATRVPQASGPEGLILQLSVPPQPEERQIAAGLIAAAEERLRAIGVRNVVTRSPAALEPMYLGLYGGSDHPGLLAADPAVEHLRAAGYWETGRVALWRRSLDGFSPVVDLVQRNLRRREWKVEVEVDPPPRGEAEAFAMVHAAHTRYRVVGPDGQGAGSCLVWDMEPLAGAAKARMAGLILIEIDALRRQSGLATLLVGDALKHSASLPSTTAHAQWDASDPASQRLFKRLGFAKLSDEGIVLRKELG